MNTFNVFINTFIKIHKELKKVVLIKDVWDDVGKPNIVYIKYCEISKLQVFKKLCDDENRRKEKNKASGS